MKIGDLMQKFFMSNPKRAMWFLSTMPASFWEKKGRKKLLSSFYEVADKVPAYKKFLKEKKVKPDEINTFEDFQNKVPILDKRSYMTKYQLEHRCLGKLCQMSMISTSSGFSGRPTFWPRMAKQDLMLPRYFENFFLQNWDIDKKSTLVVVTLALGTWIAGQVVVGATKPIADSGKYPLTLITPGSDIEQIIKIVKGIGENYDQIIFIIYPSFLTPILDAGEKEGINWKKINLKIWVGGESTSLEWHDHIRERLGVDKGDLGSILHVYGTSDAGGIGFSSPLSNLVMNLTSKDKKLAQDLFKSENLPSLVQYNPMGYFIEEADGEILINYFSGVPLIRYNIHDKGGVIPYEKVKALLKDHNYDIEKMLLKKGYAKNKIWKWPFVYTFGRKDNVISIGGANIYPENIEPVLYRKEMKDVNTFKLAVETGEKGEMQFVILLELKEGMKFMGEALSKFKKQCHDIFLERLLKINEDFRDAHEDDPEYTDPLIKIYEHKKGPFTEDQKRIKRKYIL